MVSWQIQGRNPVPFDEAMAPHVPENTPFLWAMDHWRDVPCLDLFDNDGNYLDRFLYYETLIPDGIQARMNTVVEDGRAPGRALLTRRSVDNHGRRVGSACLHHHPPAGADRRSQASA
ncbi:MAG: hypothetical protein MZV70_22565 [Desulfobacterales bacterium]|nr:hypothetical protein [Desulfobacterales bacterium]